eukprot:scaffold62494_cov40-Phaeocystis_antarctica.AAC.2
MQRGVRAGCTGLLPGCIGGVAHLWFGMRRAERRQLLTQPLLQARGESWGKTRVGVRVRVR